MDQRLVRQGEGTMHTANQMHHAMKVNAEHLRLDDERGQEIQRLFVTKLEPLALEARSDGLSCLTFADAAVEAFAGRRHAGEPTCSIYTIRLGALADEARANGLTYVEFDSAAVDAYAATCPAAA